MKTLLCVAIVVLCALYGTSAQCLKTCSVNTDCQGSICQFCMGSMCGSGCSQNCTGDIDCRDLNCRYCYEGMCGNTPNNACNASCHTNTDCDQNSDCGVCNNGVCTAACGGYCSSDNECLIQGCTHCVGGTCERDSGHCGTACTVNFDCNQTSSSCEYCMGGECGSGCQQPCDLDQDCRDINCRYCFEHQCGRSPNRQCKQPCSINTDCDQSSDCATCNNNICTAGCGGVCANSSECLVPGCNHCINSVCSHDNTKCLANCQVNLDCNQTSVCSLCVAGRCGAGCGQQCNDNSQCIDTDCHYCANGSCQSQPAGVPCHGACTVDSQCTGSPGTCGSCFQHKCGSTCSSACLTNTDCVVHHCGTCNSGKCTAP